MHAACRPMSCVCCNYAAPMRHVIAVILLCGVIVSYCHRVSLSIAITEMVQPDKKLKKIPECPVKINITKVSNKSKLKWTESDQGWILMAFYIGYAAFHLPLGYIMNCPSVGARWIFASGMIVSTVTTAVIPIVIKKLGLEAFIVLRCLTGIGQASVFVSITQLLARWIPPDERSSICGMVFAGNSLGSIIGIAGTGLIVEFMKEWEGVYYVWAVVSGVWCVFYLLYVYTDPLTHPTITIAEKDYLVEVIAPGKHAKCPPLFLMLADPAVWALSMMQFSHNYVLFFMITNVPKYMKDILQVQLKKNSLISSLPHIAQYLGGVLSGILSDYLIKKKNCRVHMLRKLYAVICTLMPSLFLILLGMCRCNDLLVMFCFVGGLFFKGFFYAGPKVNTLDLSANHAGFLMALQNGLGSISGFVSPKIVAELTVERTFKSWDLVWYITFAVTNLLTLGYVFLSSGHRALWDYPPEERAAIKEARKEEKLLKKSKPKIKWYLERSAEDFAAWSIKQQGIIDVKNAKAKEEKQHHIEQAAKIKEEKRAAKEAKAKNPTA